MRHLSLCLLSSLFLLSTLCQAEIRECSSTEEVLNLANGKALVIWDIDNTILCPSQSLGSDPWFRHYHQKLKDEGVNDKDALETAVDMLHKIYHRTRVRLIEEKTPKVIDILQKRKLPVIAITTRSPEVAECTINHLASLGIDMKKGRPLHQDFEFAECCNLLFKDGVLFTTGSHKGTAFAAFLKRCDFSPSRVVFIDDKAAYLHEIEEVCAAKGIEFIGLRYSGADEIVKNFRPEVADLQQRYFQGIVSDEIALQLLQN